MVRFLAVLVILTACGGGSDEEPEAPGPSIAEGKAVYDRICSTCHGLDARGLPGLGQDLYNNTFSQSLGDQELVDFLKVGRPSGHPLNQTGVDMPPRGGDPTITEDELKSIVAFLRTLEEE
jgi:disulfide bond formation protein DsbB